MSGEGNGCVDGFESEAEGLAWIERSGLSEKTTLFQMCKAPGREFWALLRKKGATTIPDGYEGF